LSGSLFLLFLEILFPKIKDITKKKKNTNSLREKKNDKR
jgi:hypothetical protein